MCKVVFPEVFSAVSQYCPSSRLPHVVELAKESVPSCARDMLSMVVSIDVADVKLLMLVEVVLESGCGF